MRTSLLSGSPTRLIWLTLGAFAIGTEGFMAAFEPHVGMTNYLFGSRPSFADLAWFGQLSEMATDPMPMRILRERAPLHRSLGPASG
jgi:glutathione S-transferase